LQPSFLISEAFDSIPHDQRIFSLSQMGIRGSLLYWFIDNLTNRKQKVVLDNYSSFQVHSALFALNFHREEKIDHYVTETKTIIKYSPPVTTKTKTIVDNLLLK